MPVVDASFTAALFNEGDASHTAAARWYNVARLGPERFSAPTLILPEIASALGRTQAQPARAAAALAVLRDRRFITLAAITPALAELAAELAYRHGLRGCDAIYVALAQELGQTLVTFDREQAARASSVVVTVIPS